MTRLVGLHRLGSAVEKLLLVVKTCVDVHLRLLDLGQVVVAGVNFVPYRLDFCQRSLQALHLVDGPRGADTRLTAGAVQLG